MEIKNKTVSKKHYISKMLNAAALIVAILGIVSLANSIYVFIKTINQYVAQGYPSATVIKQLLPSQLLPGILEPIAVYGGIAIVLLAVKMINEKVSKCLEMLTPVEVCDNNTDSDIKENVDENINATDDHKTEESSDNAPAEENLKEDITEPENEKKDEQLQA